MFKLGFGVKFTKNAGLVQIIRDLLVRSTRMFYISELVFDAISYILYSSCCATVELFLRTTRQLLQGRGTYSTLPKVVTCLSSS